VPDVNPDDLGGMSESWIPCHFKSRISSTVGGEGGCVWTFLFSLQGVEIEKIPINFGSPKPIQKVERSRNMAGIRP